MKRRVCTNKGSTAQLGKSVGDRDVVTACAGSERSRGVVARRLTGRVAIYNYKNCMDSWPKSGAAAGSALTKVP